MTSPSPHAPDPRHIPPHPQSGRRKPAPRSLDGETMATREDYVYLPLADARKAVGVKVNLFVAVVEIGGASHIKGTDENQSMTLAATHDYHMK